MNFFDRAWRLREKIVAPAQGGRLSRIVHKLRLRRYHYLEERFGFSIPEDALIKSKPYLPHGVHGIFISKRAKIGAHCVIFHQVTVGANTMMDSKGLGAPQIGDRCYIGAGAKIIGGITIGNDVRIGANATVTRDVPDFATVVGLNDIKEAEYPRDNRYYSKGPKGWYANDGARSVLLPTAMSARLDTAFVRTRL